MYGKKSPIYKLIFVRGIVFRPGRSSTEPNIINSSVVLRIYPSDGCQPMQSHIQLVDRVTVRGEGISMKVIAYYDVSLQ